LFEQRIDDIIYHSERRDRLWPDGGAGAEDMELVNAGGQHVTLLPEVAWYHADSFAIRPAASTSR
jgi:hypothetical protein